MKPRLLDLMCGAGGCTRGYQRAGFEVWGVDVREQPHYCGDHFTRADVFELEPWFLSAFDAIHASPPCQTHVQWQNLNAERYGSRTDHPDLVEPTRDLLKATGLPYVLENVVGAPLREPTMLCGSHFGLGVRRHRLFESSVFLMRQPGCQHSGDEIAVYGKLDGRRIWTRADGSEARVARRLDEASVAMDIDWMQWRELCEAIPPAYTELIGLQLRQHIDYATRRSHNHLQGARL